MEGFAVKRYGTYRSSHGIDHVTEISHEGNAWPWERVFITAMPERGPPLGSWIPMSMTTVVVPGN